MKSKSLKNDFPVFKHNKMLVYLDSAATALKPQRVIDAVSEYYSVYPANVFRGVYDLSQKATEAFENSRTNVAHFINAYSPSEVIFTRGTTESINFIAYAWGRLNISKDDEIITTIMEHHSNFIPWQQLCRETGATFKIIDVTEDGLLDIGPDYAYLKQIITKKTKLVVLTHVSNVLGTINPVKDIVSAIKEINKQCLVLIDGAQAAPHMPVDVQDIGCDFYVFSGHKMMGPTGIGVLWMKQEVANAMPPFHFGGSMIQKVTLKNTTYAEPPQKFEAGTPHIAGAIGLSAAIDYMNTIGIATIRKHEMELTEYALNKLSEPDSSTLYGQTIVRHRGGVISFNIFDSEQHLIHPHDVADILSRNGICVRAGHHCAMPLTERLHIPASVRVSFHMYNDRDDVDRLINGLRKAKKIFA